VVGSKPEHDTDPGPGPDPTLLVYNVLNYLMGCSTMAQSSPAASYSLRGSFLSLPNAASPFPSLLANVLHWSFKVNTLASSILSTVALSLIGSGLSSRGQKVNARSHVLKPDWGAGAAAAAVAALNSAANASVDPKSNNVTSRVFP
jgi:hypothetical protein